MGNLVGEAVTKETHNRVATRVRVGYCIAIAVIAALAIASLSFVSRANTNLQSVNALTDVVADQQTLSQRIVLLTNIAYFEDNTFKRAVAANSLREAIQEFRRGHDNLKEKLAAIDDPDAAILSDIVYRPPYDADFFSVTLGDTAEHFLSLLLSGEDGQTLMPLSQTQSMAAYSSLSTLKDAIHAYVSVKIEQTMRLHQGIFAGLMLLLALEALLIFAPLARAINERTNQLKSARDHMAKLANHDQLTGLQNRTAMAHWFPKIVQDHASKGEPLSVAHIDLDNFKAINDTYGHAAGDAVLMETGRRLQALVRGNDFTARVGGDEFVLLLPGTGDEADVAPILDRLLEELAADVTFNGTRLTIGVSVGVAKYPVDATTTEALLVNADLALYQAKRTASSKYVFFRPSMSDDFSKNRSLERLKLQAGAAAVSSALLGSQTASQST